MINIIKSRITRQDLIDLVTTDQEILNDITDNQRLVLDGFFFLAQAWRRLGPAEQSHIKSFILQEFEEQMEPTEVDIFELLNQFSSRDLTIKSAVANQELTITEGIN